MQELLHALRIVRGVVVEYDDTTLEIMHARHRLKKFMDYLAIGAIGQSIEELAAAHSAQDSGVDSLLFAEGHLDPGAWLPKPALALPEIRARFIKEPEVINIVYKLNNQINLGSVNLPDFAAVVDSLHQVLYEE